MLIPFIILFVSMQVQTKPHNCFCDIQAVGLNFSINIDRKNPGFAISTYINKMVDRYNQFADQAVKIGPSDEQVKIYPRLEFAEMKLVYNTPINPKITSDSSAIGKTSPTFNKYRDVQITFYVIPQTKHYGQSESITITYGGRKEFKVRYNPPAGNTNQPRRPSMAISNKRQSVVNSQQQSNSSSEFSASPIFERYTVTFSKNKEDFSAVKSRIDNAKAKPSRKVQQTPMKRTSTVGGNKEPARRPSTAKGKSTRKSTVGQNQDKNSRDFVEPFPSYKTQLNTYYIEKFEFNLCVGFHIFMNKLLRAHNQAEFNRKEIVRIPTKAIKDKRRVYHSVEMPISPVDQMAYQQDKRVCRTYNSSSPVSIPYQPIFSNPKALPQLLYLIMMKDQDQRNEVLKKITKDPKWHSFIDYKASTELPKKKFKERTKAKLLEMEKGWNGVLGVKRPSSLNRPSIINLALPKNQPTLSKDPIPNRYSKNQVPTNFRMSKFGADKHLDFLNKGLNREKNPINQPVNILPKAGPANLNTQKNDASIQGISRKSTIKNPTPRVSAVNSRKSKPGGARAEEQKKIPDLKLVETNTLDLIKKKLGMNNPNAPENKMNQNTSTITPRGNEKTKPDININGSKEPVILKPNSNTSNEEHKQNKAQPKMVIRKSKVKFVIPQNHKEGQTNFVIPENPKEDQTNLAVPKILPKEALKKILANNPRKENQVKVNIQPSNNEKQNSQPFKLIIGTIPVGANVNNPVSPNMDVKQVLDNPHRNGPVRALRLDTVQKTIVTNEPADFTGHSSSDPKSPADTDESEEGEIGDLANQSLVNELEIYYDETSPENLDDDDEDEELTEEEIVQENSKPKSVQSVERKTKSIRKRRRGRYSVKQILEIGKKVRTGITMLTTTSSPTFKDKTFDFEEEPEGTIEVISLPKDETEPVKFEEISKEDPVQVSRQVAIDEDNFICNFNSKKNTCPKSEDIIELQTIKFSPETAEIVLLNPPENDHCSTLKNDIEKIRCRRRKAYVNHLIEILDSYVKNPDYDSSGNSSVPQRKSVIASNQQITMVIYVDYRVKIEPASVSDRVFSLALQTKEYRMMEAVFNIEDLEINFDDLFADIRKPNTDGSESKKIEYYEVIKRIEIKMMILEGDKFLFFDFDQFAFPMEMNFAECNNYLYKILEAFKLNVQTGEEDIVFNPKQIENLLERHFPQDMAKDINTRQQLLI